MRWLCVWLVASACGWDEIGPGTVERGPLCVLLPSDVVVAVVDRGAEGAVRILRVFNVG